MFGIPSPWLILGAVGIWLASAVGGFFAGHHYAALSYDKAIATQKTEAAQLLADANAKIAAEVLKTATLNNQLEADHAKALSDITAAHDDFNRRVARLVRPRCGPSGGGTHSTETAGATVSPQPSEDAGVWISQRTVIDLGNLAASADELTAYAKACHAWAVENGS